MCNGLFLSILDIKSPSEFAPYTRTKVGKASPDGQSSEISERVYSAAVMGRLQRKELTSSVKPSDHKLTQP